MGKRAVKLEPIISERQKYTKRGAADEWLRENLPLARENDCLIWPFRRNDRGYAVAGGHRRVHREVCALFHGPAPTPKHEAAHSCGQGHLGCVNPHHLRWATHAENIQDKFAHGTVRRGERCPTAKLTEAAVREIRAATTGYGQDQKYALKFGVSTSAVRMARDGRRWGAVE